MGNLNRFRWSALAVLSLLFGVNCGKFIVDHHVDGTIQIPVTVSLDSQMFLPFFLSDCQARTAGQKCYDLDPSKCATCMANSLFSYLTAGTSPAPSPSPSPTAAN